jgi:plastocyanin
MRRIVISRIAFICLSAVPAAGVSPVGVLISNTVHAHRATTQMIGIQPRTWHVIAGFTQVLPAGNKNTEVVNQFYPRMLTIYRGDSVTWTINAHSEIHTVTFAPDSVLRKLEDPNHQIIPRKINGKQFFLANPTVFLPSARGPLVESDSGSAQHLLNCGQIGPVGTPRPQSCTITFPNPGSFAYDCLLHSGIPGNGDMDGVIRVVARPKPTNQTWTVLAGTGTVTDADVGFFPPHLTIHAGDRVTWKSGGEHFHTVSFGIDPRKAPLIVPVGKTPQGRPILAFNPIVFSPSFPKGGVYTGGVASSGILGLTGNYANLPGQPFLRAPFTLTFARPGVYTYYCLVHAPLMAGTITVLPANQ